jgi:pyruvate dehydrogenase E1 component alpha subunit
VGAHLPIAAGLALGDQYQKNDGVTICMFGDGATNIGFFHEALNLSKVWNLPVLWVCENNQYGMGTAVERASAVPEMRQKAEGYNMPNDQIDGMDVMKVRETSLEILEKIRSGEGPYFLEILTYRFRGHSMGDPERYRKPDEIKKYQENDPIGIYRRHLLENEIAKEGELDDLDTRAEAEIQEAVEFAESSPDPEPEALFEHIYVES